MCVQELLDELNAAGVLLAIAHPHSRVLQKLEVTGILDKARELSSLTQSVLKNITSAAYVVRFFVGHAFYRPRGGRQWRLVLRSYPSS